MKYTNQFTNLQWKILSDSTVLSMNFLQNIIIPNYDVYSSHIHTFIQCGFNSLECYVLYYPSPNKVIVVNKKQLSLSFGSSLYYQIVSKLLYNTTEINYNNLPNIIETIETNSIENYTKYTLSHTFYKIKSETMISEMKEKIVEIGKFVKQFISESVTLLQNDLGVEMTDIMKDETKAIRLNCNYTFPELETCLEKYCKLKPRYIALTKNDFLCGGLLYLQSINNQQTVIQLPSRDLEVEIIEILQKERFKMIFTEESSSEEK